jgi:hypothetical protein
VQLNPRAVVPLQGKFLFLGIQHTPLRLLSARFVDQNESEMPDEEWMSWNSIWTRYPPTSTPSNSQTTASSSFSTWAPPSRSI